MKPGDVCTRSRSDEDGRGQERGEICISTRLTSSLRPPPLPPARNVFVSLVSLTIIWALSACRIVLFLSSLAVLPSWSFCHFCLLCLLPTRLLFCSLLHWPLCLFALLTLVPAGCLFFSGATRRRNVLPPLFTFIGALLLLCFSSLLVDSHPGVQCGRGCLVCGNTTRNPPAYRRWMWWEATTHHLSYFFCGLSVPRLTTCRAWYLDFSTFW